jgi:hypothetical protein
VYSLLLLLLLLLVAIVIAAAAHCFGAIIEVAQLLCVQLEK